MKNKNNKNKRNRRRPKTAVVKTAPFLFKERVVLTDIVTIGGNSNGDIASLLNANGYTGVTNTAL